MQASYLCAVGTGHADPIGQLATIPEDVGIEYPPQVGGEDPQIVGVFNAAAIDRLLAQSPDEIPTEALSPSTTTCIKQSINDKIASRGCTNPKE